MPPRAAGVRDVKPCRDRYRLEGTVIEVRELLSQERQGQPSSGADASTRPPAQAKQVRC